MRAQIRVVATAVAALCFACTVASSGQTSSEAEGLFSQGRDLMEKGRFAEACPKLAASQNLAPAVGTMLNLGLCYEKSGRYASAWNAYKEAEILAESGADAKRASFAHERAAVVEPRIAKLIVKPPSPEPPGLEITRDGAPIVKAQWGQALPVDSEDLVISAKAPARVNWQTTVRVAGDGGTLTVTIPELAEGFCRTKTEPGRPPHPRGEPLGMKRAIALGLGGVGLIGLTAGTVLAFTAQSTYDSAARHCDATGCDLEGNELQKDAVARGTWATVAFGLGLAAVGGGVALWILGGSDHGGSSIAINAHPSGLSVRGDF